MSVLEQRIVLQPVSKALGRWDERAFQVVRRVRSKTHLQQALQTLVSEVTRELQVDRCFMLEFDRNKNPLPITIEALRNENVPSFKGMVLPWDRCPYGNKISGKQVIWAQDIWNDASVELDEELSAFVHQHYIRGLVLSPIVYEDEILCVLFAQTLTPRHWDEGELLFTQISSDQAAISVFQTRAAQLYNQLLESEARYQNLYQWEKKTREVFQAIRNPIDTHTAYPAAIREMGMALNANRAFVIEFDKGQVRPVRYEYRSHETVKSFVDQIPPWDVSPYLALVTRNEMAWSADTWSDDQFTCNEQWARFSRQYDIRGIVAAPILYNDQLMNVVVFHTTEPHCWSEQELFFIKVLSEQLSTIFYQEKLREEMVEAAQIKSDFLSKMSHELRTPLNAILGFTQMLSLGMAGPLTEKQREYLEHATVSSEHLLSLVNDILDFSKVEAGKMTIKPEEIEIDMLIGEVRAMMDGFARKKGIHLSFEIQPELRTVTADPARMKQILINLVSNAIKFNKKEGKVSVRLFRDKNQPCWVTDVQDTGIGISREKLPELFTKFHQFDNSASRSHDGTGLGLVLTKELVELHGGVITVNSEEGIGSTFTFKLPIAS